MFQGTQDLALVRAMSLNNTLDLTRRVALSTMLVPLQERFNMEGSPPSPTPQPQRRVPMLPHLLHRPLTPRQSHLLTLTPPALMYTRAQITLLVADIRTMFKAMQDTPPVKPTQAMNICHLLKASLHTM